MQELIEKMFVRKCFHMQGRSDWKNPPQVPYKINRKNKRHSYPLHYPNNVVLTWKLEHGGQCHKIIIYLNFFFLKGGIEKVAWR